MEIADMISWTQDVIPQIENIFTENVNEEMPKEKEGISSSGSTQTRYFESLLDEHTSSSSNDQKKSTNYKLLTIINEDYKCLLEHQGSFLKSACDALKNLTAYVQSTKDDEEELYSRLIAIRLKALSKKEKLMCMRKIDDVFYELEMSKLK